MPAPEPDDLYEEMLASDRAAADELGIDADTFAQAQAMTQGVPLLSGGLPIAASKGEFSTFEAIFYGDGDEVLESASVYYDPMSVHFPKKSGAAKDPAPITLVPTSTTNPERPRTVAAGYDKARKTITVIFRDGTWYNYYQCDGNLWNRFKSARSKGRYILAYLDPKPRGYANVAQMPSAGRELLYKITRTHQIQMEGFQPEHSRKSKRGTGGHYYHSRNKK